MYPVPKELRREFVFGTCGVKFETYSVEGNTLYLIVKLVSADATRLEGIIHQNQHMVRYLANKHFGVQAGRIGIMPLSSTTTKNFITHSRVEEVRLLIEVEVIEGDMW